MKIVFTIKSINLAGGSERSTVTLANALVARGYDVAIVSYVGSDKKPFFQIDNRISCYYLSPQRERYPVLIREVRRIVMLRKLYAQLQPDIIIVIGTTRAFVNVPSTRGYCTITKEYFAATHRSQLTSSWSRRLTARYSDAIWVLTQADADIYRNDYHAKNVVVIPNLRTLPHVTASNLQHKVVLCLGRMTRTKGTDLLLQAWRKVQHTDWELHLVGDGALRKGLEEEVRKYQMQNVRFFGATADVLPHYQQASIFVLPSRSEAFGNVLIEAMSVGLPTVSFDCGKGIKEIVEADVTGIVVPAQDTTKMAQALDALMDDTARLHAMSAAALERVKRYDEDHILQAWEELLLRLSKR